MNPAETVILVDLDHSNWAQQLFGGTEVQIKASDCRYLERVLGSTDFRHCFLEAAIGK